MNATSLKIIAGALALLAVAGCTPTEEKQVAGAAPNRRCKPYCNAARYAWGIA
jgi:hypothetical protein